MRLIYGLAAIIVFTMTLLSHNWSNPEVIDYLNSRVGILIGLIFLVLGKIDRVR